MGNQTSNINQTSDIEQKFTEDDIFCSKILKCGMYPVLAFVRNYSQTDEQRKKHMNDVKNFTASMGILYSPTELTKEDEVKMIKILAETILSYTLDKKDFRKAPVKMEKYRTVIENMANGIIQPDALQLMEELGRLPTQ